MNKTPEELAADYCEPILSDDYARAIGREDWIGTRCVKVEETHEMYKAFLAGYKAGSEVTEQEIADIIVDIRQREAEERKRPQRERQARIWEKVKIKIIGVF